MNQYQQYQYQQAQPPVQRYDGYIGENYTIPSSEGYYPTSEPQAMERPYQGMTPPPPEAGVGIGYPPTYSVLGMPETDSHVLAGLSYLGLWVTGLIFLIFGVKNRLIRFHALQSLLFFGTVNVLYIFLITIMANQVPFIWGFAVLAFVLMNIVALIGWVYGMVGAFSGRFTKLPFVGDIAERAVGRDPFLK